MANQFQNDPHCVALWRFEDAWDVDGVSSDSIGGNHLIPMFAAPTGVTDHREGSYACDFDDSSTMGLQCHDSSLDAGFPCRYADAAPQKTFSICLWIKPSQLPPEGERDELIGKYLAITGTNKRTFLLYLGTTSGVTNVKFAKGYSAGTLAESTIADGVAIAAGQWYHIGLTYDDATGAVRIRVYDATAATVYDKTATHAESISVTDVTLTLGNRPYANTSNAYDGIEDEVVVFDDILTADEIDQIRMGNYMRQWEGRFAVAAALSCTSFSVITVAPWYGEARWDIVERLAWSTDTIKGNDGSPQRLARRTVPLQYLRIPFVLRTPEAAAEWSMMVHAWAKRMWPIPLWHESTQYRGTLAAGVSSIALDTRYADYRAAGLALAWDSAGNAEMVEVSTVADDALTLARATLRAHESPWVMPLRYGNLLAEIERERLAGGASLVEMAFAVDDIAAVTGHVAAMTVDDMDVLTEPGQLAGEFRERIDPDVIRLQTPTGRLGIANVTTFPIATQSHGWYPTTRAACWSLRQWLHAMVGGQKPFLVPTFQPDLVLSRPAGAADTTLYVANRGYVRMGVNALRTYVAFRPAGGSLIVKKVNAVDAVSASEESLGLASAPGTAFAAGASLCWCDRCLLPDEIDLTWYGRGKLTCEAQLERVSQ